MKQHIKKFFLHGLISMGFGPIILSIVYACLYFTGVAQVLSIPEVVKAVLSITLMAFIAGGLPVLYQIERLPLLSAILLHALGLYIDYLVMYLFNDWIVKDFTAIGIFTVIFFSGFALIWAIIYLINRNHASKLNQRLQH